ncbi:hypothetical protein ACIBTV_05780 [Micromonospora sp. NPDC049366]|uniref:hypothetical protein n=1 Tax=Micromonospora sp. NPDC049366 TaxID=3364271 RepID=UPI00378FDC37
MAAINVTVPAAETSVQTLLDAHLPKLLRTAADIGHDWALTASVSVPVLTT